MATSILPAMARAAWDLVTRQHGVIARWQLLDLGFSAAAIRHRLDSGRLYLIYRGVYAVGRKELPQEGKWMAAVLAAGPGAILSHQSAAELWGIRSPLGGIIDVSVPPGSWRRRKGLRIHKLSPRMTSSVVDGIPVADVVTTLVQLAPSLTLGELERAINEADRLDVIDPEELRSRLDNFAGYPASGRCVQLSIAALSQ
jgi:predicted transcriptional regulator of viral defense system